MLNLDFTTLQAVADQALLDAAAHTRWIAAIGRALIELDTNPWIERGDMHGLIIGSTSGRCYAANGTCQCTAFEFKTPCWHRAAARLVRLHDEREAAAQVVAEAEPLLAAVMERHLAPLHERLAKARAEMAELFA